MSIYPVVLVLHIVGAIGYFLSIGIWLFILVGLRRTQHVEQVRALIDIGSHDGGSPDLLMKNMCSPT